MGNCFVLYMKKIALTGGIAAGKTTVMNFFSSQGVATIDSDAIVSLLYKKPFVKRFLQRHFSSIEKKKIARIVFSDAKKRALLEKFLHPLVFSEIESRIEKFECAKKKLVIIDIPLLLDLEVEKKFSHLFGKTILVKATQPQQVYRLQKKGYCAADAFARIHAQARFAKSIKRHDFIIDNSRSLQETKKQVKKILAKLKK